MQIVVTLYCLGNKIKKKSVHVQYRSNFSSKYFQSLVGWTHKRGTCDYGALTVYYEMITTIKLINISITLYSYHLCAYVYWEHLRYLLANFK
jgi:hypothetical protein